MVRIISLFAIFLLSFTANAQDIYNMVLGNATRIVNTPTSPYTPTQIAQFKRTALIYLKSKAVEQTDSVTTQFLDTQAYFLSEYLTLFFDEIIKSKRLSEAKRRARIVLFMETSVANPLFNDSDTETTMAFINAGGEITPFCLNTDWQKAFLAAEDRLQEAR